MSKEMIISVNGREKKIAILDNGKVTEFYIERGDENSGIAGNIYKGRVQRVLPGMQSAFVSVGLERDAFLYVSDFFDEEEEIERIVMEKSKKSTPEEAKREANDQIDRARIEREKQMEAVQEIAEPIDEFGEHEEPEDIPAALAGSVTEAEGDVGRRGGRGRGRKDGRGRQNERPAERSGTARTEETSPPFQMEDSGFERIIDDEDTGELFKDAFRQEAIVDKVRAVEFEMETTPIAEVGSLIGSVTDEQNGFERIADDDDAQPVTKPAKGGRGKKAKGDDAEGKPARKTKPAAEKKPRKSSAKAAKAEAENETEGITDGEASVRESGEIAEMTVRRGGRGRRRGGRGRRPEGAETTEESTENEGGEAGSEVGDVPTEAPAVEAEARPAEVSEAAPAAEREPADAPEPTSEEREPRARRDTRDGRGTRDRKESRPREDRPGVDRPREDRPRDENRSRGGQQDSGKRFERGDRRDRPAQPTISDLLREGQEILVQIAKEPIARKGARITSHIALPGRFLVYMPTIEHLGVSRKIESANERSRLRTLIQRIRQDETIPSGGFIVRTAGIGISEEDLRQDARYLVRTWQDVKKTTEKAKSPALVHQDLDLVQRLLRDQLSDEFTAIRVDSEEEYLRTIEFINRIQPRLVNRVKFYTREEPILDSYGVQEEVDKALKPRVWLRSGGYLVINQTEALVAIDVNTGKFVGKGNARLEDTITRTNMEAVDEIARQIRLRDLGGIIVLDLIDMEDRRNRHKVSQALQEALQDDKSPTKVLSFNDFGLIIMTRKRVKQSLERTMCAPCDYCEGAGWIKSPTTICYEILMEARRLSKHLDDVRQTTLRIHPEVAKSLRSAERAVLEEIEAYLGNVDLSADPTIHQAQFDFAFI
ncbi:MAG: Rne/Rng family ribonuclease [Pyrinomonadaceae bacterium]